MKKVILTFVFVLTITPLLNAKTLDKQLVVQDCFGYAIQVLEDMEAALWPMSDSMGASIMNDAYASCYCLENTSSSACWDF